MKQIELFEKMISEFKEHGTEIDNQLEKYDNPSTLGMVFDAYEEAKRCDEKYIDVACHLRDEEIDAFLKCLDFVGLTEFADTNQSTGLMDNLFEFQNRGWKVQGLEEITIEGVCMTKKGISRFKKKPAIILRKETNI